MQQDYFCWINPCRLYCPTKEVKHTEHLVISKYNTTDEFQLEIITLSTLVSPAGTGNKLPISQRILGLTRCQGWKNNNHGNGKLKNDTTHPFYKNKQMLFTYTFNLTLYAIVIMIVWSSDVGSMYALACGDGWITHHCCIQYQLADGSGQPQLSVLCSPYWSYISPSNLKHWSMPAIPTSKYPQQSTKAGITSLSKIHEAINSYYGLAQAPFRA